MKAAAVLIVMLSVIGTAAAQISLLPPRPGIMLPPTIKMTDKNGVVIGTMTIWAGRGYLRDRKGELLGTLVNNPDGTQTFYDPSGNVMTPPKLPQQ